jgi:hypothetical protein
LSGRREAIGVRATARDKRALGDNVKNNYRMLVPVAMLGLGVGIASTAWAQSAAPVNRLNNPTASDNDMKATAQNNSFSGWTSDYSKSHQGRVSRQAYMDEAGRRWDAMDKNRQGLTSDEINRTYGYGWNNLGADNSMDKGK